MLFWSVHRLLLLFGSLVQSDQDITSTGSKETRRDFSARDFQCCPCMSMFLSCNECFMFHARDSTKGLGISNLIPCPLGPLVPNVPCKRTLLPHSLQSSQTLKIKPKGVHVGQSITKIIPHLHFPVPEARVLKVCTQYPSATGQVSLDPPQRKGTTGSMHLLPQGAGLEVKRICCLEPSDT